MPRHIYLRTKRAVDVVLSSIMLVLLFPLLLPISLVLKFTAEGEVFYFQDRIGYKNQTFRIWKFATMLKNSPFIGSGSLTVRNDPRVTPVGKYLRIMKINELPQLFNVLIGDMSFVGPRPQMDVDFLAFPEHVRETIYDSVPGITGLGSIVYRDEEKLISEANSDPKEFYKAEIAPHKGELELWYRDNASLVLDLKLMLLTVWVVFVPNSAFADGWVRKVTNAD